MLLLLGCGEKEEVVSKTEAPVTEPTRAESRQFESLTIELIMQGPGLIGTPPSRLRFSADGKRVYFRWNDPAKLDSLNAKEPLSAYENYRSLEDEARTYVMKVDDGSITPLEDEVADTLVPDNAAWNRMRDRRAEIRDGDVYLVDLASGKARRMTETLANERSVQMSPSGDRVYFVRDGNLYSINWDGGAIRQLTNLKTKNPPRGKDLSDQREFLVEQQKTLFDDFKQEKNEPRTKEFEPVYLGSDWEIEEILVSPSGRYAAVEISKEPEGARRPLVPHFVTESGYMETKETRPKVGDLREATQVKLVDLDGDSLIAVNIDGSLTTSLRSWSPTSDVLLVRSIDGEFKTRYFYAVDPDNRGAEKEIRALVLDEYSDDAWVGGPGFYSTGAWLQDGGGIFYLSEEEGFSHLYTVSSDGLKRKRLTTGQWEVYSAEQSHDGASWYLITNEGDPGSHRLWVMDWDGANRRVLTPDVGRYEPAFSPDGAVAVIRRSTLNRPPELYVFDLMNDILRGPVTESTTELYRSFAWTWPEAVSIKASDGERFRAHIFRPESFGKRPNDAGVIFIHGAGYLQNVNNWWSYYYREYMFNHFLAMNGYTVLNVDFRGSAGYGRACRTAIHRHMGGRDLDDVIDAARYLTQKEGVDKDKVGLYGGSYGGFLVIMGLFKYPDVISCGAAIRSVTDWAHYNHWYTSRILGTPQEDPEAYERSSPINFADGFEGGLLMLHGLVDDNVLAADVLRLSQLLIELGKQDWELMLYPAEPHDFQRASSWTDEYRRIFKLFEQNMRGRK